MFVGFPGLRRTLISRPISFQSPIFGFKQHFRSMSEQEAAQAKKDKTEGKKRGRQEARVRSTWGCIDRTAQCAAPFRPWPIS